MYDSSIRFYLLLIIKVIKGKNVQEVHMKVNSKVELT
jgi:hypothetical protein